MGVSWQTDHLTGTSAPAPQRSKSRKLKRAQAQVPPSGGETGRQNYIMNRHVPGHLPFWEPFGRASLTPSTISDWCEHGSALGTLSPCPNHNWFLRIYYLNLAPGRTIHARSGNGPAIYRVGSGNDGRKYRRDETGQNQGRREKTWSKEESLQDDGFYYLVIS
ncbi:hypothetical protein TNCV_3988771 [Trichonephila clavipes]|nr:hypothetical protein TNCV_3988771 [Trichonephila clavipes]